MQIVEEKTAPYFTWKSSGRDTGIYILFVNRLLRMREMCLSGK